jgi:hypothetical protein
VVAITSTQDSRARVGAPITWTADDAFMIGSLCLVKAGFAARALSFQSGNVSRHSTEIRM